MSESSSHVGSQHSPRHKSEEEEGEDAKAADGSDDTPSIPVKVHVQLVTEANCKARKGIGPQGTPVGEFKIPVTATTADILAELEKLAGPKDGGDDSVAWYINFTLSDGFTNLTFNGFENYEARCQVVSEYMGFKNYGYRKPVYLTLKKDLRATEAAGNVTLVSQITKALENADLREEFKPGPAARMPMQENGRFATAPKRRCVVL